MRNIIRCLLVRTLTLLFDLYYINRNTSIRDFFALYIVQGAPERNFAIFSHPDKGDTQFCTLIAH